MLESDIILEVDEDQFCPICFDQIEHLLKLECCGHKFCKSCLNQYCNTQVNLISYRIECPQANCNSFISTQEALHFGLNCTSTYIQKVRTLFSIEQFQLIRCPNEQCQSLLKKQSLNPTVNCEACKHEYCVYCSNWTHPIERCPNYNDYLFDVYCNKNNVKICPNCGVRTENISGCCEVRCIICNTIWCLKCNVDSTQNWSRYASESWIHWNFYFSKFTFYKSSTWLDILKLWLSPISIFWILGIELFIFIHSKLLRDYTENRRSIAIMLTLLALTVCLPQTIVFASVLLPLEFVCHPSRNLGSQVMGISIAIFLIPIALTLIVCAFVILVVGFHLSSYILALLKLIKIILRKDYGAGVRIIF